MTADRSQRAGAAVRGLVEVGVLRAGWVPGMMLVEAGTEFRARVTGADDLWLHTAYGDAGTGWLRIPRRSAGEWNPDTTDPLTVFGLLVLAREAHDDPSLWCESNGGDTDDWAVYSSLVVMAHRVSTGGSEAAAIVAALEARLEAARRERAAGEVGRG